MLLFMSSRDYIDLKSMKQTKNLYPYFTSSSFAQKRKLKAILEGCSKDMYGDPNDPVYNNIKIIDKMESCLPNTYNGPVTTPVFYGTPAITTPNVKLTKNQPLFY